MPYRPRRRQPIGRRAARREGNMADDSTETKENDGNIGQEPPEQPHDVERTWRRIALAAAAVVIVGSGLCIGKEAENANAGAANASAIANTNSEAKDAGNNGDEAYALTSPLPEERIAEKINEVCPNETYVIKNRSVGTDTSGNPYADYECAVTSGRDIVFEARDYVVEEKNGSKRRGFYCDYVEKVAGYHRKSVENILRESALDYTIDRDGMTYTVKVTDDAACETLAKAFTSIATEYARSESGYNTAKWLDDTKVVSVFATGTESGSGVTLTCASTIPDMSSTAEKIKAAVDTAKSANRNGTNDENADKKQSEAKVEKLAKKKASQLIGKVNDKRAISTKAGAFVGTTIVKKAKETVDEAKNGNLNGKQENNVEKRIDEAKTEAIAKKQASRIVGKIKSDTTLSVAAGKSIGTTIAEKAKEAVSETKGANGNESQAKAEAAAKKTASRIVSEIKEIGNPSHKAGTTLGTTIAEKAEKAVNEVKNANVNGTADAREDKTEEEALAKKKLSRILESIREETESRDKAKKSLAATLAERSGTAIKAVRTGNAGKLRAKLLGSLGDAL